MRALLIPLLGAKSNIPSESCWVNFRWLWRKARELYPRFYAHVALPQEVAALCEADLTSEERTYLEVIPESHVPFAFHAQENCLDPVIIERFNRYCGTSWCDLVLTARIPIGQPLQLALRDWRGQTGCPRVVLWEPGIDQDFFNQGACADPVRLAKAYSMATCPTQYLTQREFDIALEWGRRFLSPAMVDSMQRIGRVLQPRLKSIAPAPLENPTEHTLFFGARLNATKRVEWITEFYARVFALGHPVKMVVTSPSIIKPAVGKAIRNLGRGPNGEWLIELIAKCGREQFADVMKRATICVIASSYEGFPFGFLQIAASGMLTLFPDRPWARDTMPSGYPWFYKTDAEALVLVQRALRGEWVRMVRKQLDCLRLVHGDPSNAHYDYDAERWRFFMDPSFGADPSISVNRENDLVRVLLDYAASRNGFTLAEACTHIAEHSEQITERHWAAPPAGFWPRSWVHRVLVEHAGKVDACDGPQPRYVDA